jgi:hypothetical protein
LGEILPHDGPKLAFHGGIGLFFIMDYASYG